MKQIILLTIMALLLPLPVAANILSAQTQSTSGKDPVKLVCKTGPVAKKYADTNWRVLSCNKPGFLLIVSNNIENVSGFYFILRLEGDKIIISGEGNGDQAVTDAVFEELRRMNVEEFKLLVAQTQRADKEKLIGKANEGF